MTTKKFQPTERQIANWNTITAPAMPTDDEFKAMWKKAHHNVERGWGMGKRDWVILHADDHLTKTFDYNLGLWQGRVDALNGHEEEHDPETPYGYGYRAGLRSFESFWKGYDSQARAKFTETYKVS